MQRSFSGVGRVVQSRSGKTMLLPLPQARADALGLRNHVALASLRTGRGSLCAAQQLLEAIVLTGFLAEAGFGRVEADELTAAEKAVCESIGRGSGTGEWSLGPEGTARLETIVTLYDQQLRQAPLAAVAQAGDRLARFKAGLPFGLVTKSRRGKR